jgi:hypothetical protein
LDQKARDETQIGPIFEILSNFSPNSVRKRKKNPKTKEDLEYRVEAVLGTNASRSLTRPAARPKPLKDETRTSIEPDDSDRGFEDKCEDEGFQQRGDECDWGDCDDYGGQFHEIPDYEKY